MEEFECVLRSWDEMRALSEEVAGKVRGSGFAPDVIVAIIRGGLVPAMNLSDLLGVSDLLTLRVRHWGLTATKDLKAVLESPLQADLLGKRVLLVDDLTDSGESFEAALENIRDLAPSEVKTATLIHKESSSFVPDFFAEKIDEWKWVVFPWNLTEDLCNLAGRLGKEKSPSEMRKALKASFGIELDLKTVGSVLAELDRRTQE